MYLNYLGFPCKRAINAIRCIFNKGHAALDFNNINQNFDNPSIYTKVKGQTGRRTEVIKMFQLYQKLLKNKFYKSEIQVNLQCEY